jgi:hypothetical protein
VERVLYSRKNRPAATFVSAMGIIHSARKYLMRLGILNKRRLYLNYRNSNNPNLKKTLRNTVRYYLESLQQPKDYITVNSYHSLPINKKLHGI